MRKELSETDRDKIEASIIDAHVAADRYLETGREIHEKLLEMTVSDALECIQSVSAELTDDPKKEHYKLHLLIPLQLLNLIKEK